MWPEATFDKKIANFILENFEKQEAPYESTGREVSFEWSLHRISSTDSKVRDTWQKSIIHSGSERVKKKKPFLFSSRWAYKQECLWAGAYNLVLRYWLEISRIYILWENSQRFDLSVAIFKNSFKIEYGFQWLESKKGVEVGNEQSTFVMPTIFSKNSNSMFENGMNQGYKMISLVLRNEQFLSFVMRPCALWQVESKLTKKAVIQKQFRLYRWISSCSWSSFVPGWQQRPGSGSDR